jgi:arylsulfatase A-like enzyme
MQGASESFWSRSRTGRRSAVLALLALAPLGACGAKPDRPINVLLISLDSTRRDMLGCYGFRSPYAPGVSPSPNLDGLASAGVLCLDAYATSPWTLPSHMTVFSGAPELVHAVEIDWLRPQAKRHSLPSILEAHGYHTSGFYSGPYLDPRFGFGHGFARYEACYGPELADAVARVSASNARADAAAAQGDAAEARAARAEAHAAELEVDRLSHRDRSSAAVATAACAELERLAAASEPFFLFAHFFDPHYDYVPPAEHDLFDPHYSGSMTGEEFWTNPALAEFDPTLPSGRKRVASDRDVEHLRALYAGDLRATDAEVGRLLARLEDLGLAEDTLVLVISDHGDEFFEHDGIGHRRTLYEEALRVPLLARLPGTLPAGARVSGLVGLDGVLGTVLELLGLPAVPGTSSPSFAGLLRGEPVVPRPLFGRVVRSVEITLATPIDGERLELPGQLMIVEESFRQGSLKILRRRQWPEALDPPPGALAALERARDEARAREELCWIDVERYPDEPEEAFSTDFSAAAPRAALKAFQERYAELARQRTAAQTVAEGPLPGMAGLGYTQSQAAPLASRLLLLPPPGRGLAEEPR